MAVENVEKAADRGPGARHSGDRLRPVEQTRLIVGSSEAAQRGGLWREGVGLVREPGKDESLHAER